MFQLMCPCEAQEYLDAQLALGMLSTAPAKEQRLKDATESPGLNTTVGHQNG